MGGNPDALKFDTCALPGMMADQLLEIQRSKVILSFSDNLSARILWQVCNLVRKTCKKKFLWRVISQPWINVLTRNLILSNPWIKS